MQKSRKTCGSQSCQETGARHNSEPPMDGVASHRPSKSRMRSAKRLENHGNSSKFIQPQALILARALGIGFVYHRVPSCANAPCHFYHMIQKNCFSARTNWVKVQIYPIYVYMVATTVSLRNVVLHQLLLSDHRCRGWPKVPPAEG